MTVDQERKTGITGVPFGRTEVSIPFFWSFFRALSHRHGLEGPSLQGMPEKSFFHDFPGGHFPQKIFWNHSETVIYFWTENTRFLVLNRFPKYQTNPFPRRSLEIRISRVLLKECRWSPRGGASPPPLGDPCILSQPRNSNFEWSPWKGIFLIFWKSVQNQKSCIFRSPQGSRTPGPLRIFSICFPTFGPPAKEIFVPIHRRRKLGVWKYENGWWRWLDFGI